MMDNRECLPSSQSFATVANPNVAQYAGSSFVMPPISSSSVMYQSQRQSSLPYTEISYGSATNVQLLKHQMSSNFENTNSSPLHCTKANHEVISAKLRTASSTTQEENVCEMICYF